MKARGQAHKFTREVMEPPSKFNMSDECRWDESKNCCSAVNSSIHPNSHVRCGATHHQTNIHEHSWSSRLLREVTFRLCVCECASGEMEVPINWKRMCEYMCWPQFECKEYFVIFLLPIVIQTFQHSVTWILHDYTFRSSPTVLTRVYLVNVSMCTYQKKKFTPILISARIFSFLRTTIFSSATFVSKTVSTKTKWNDVVLLRVLDAQRYAYYIACDTYCFISNTLSTSVKR